MSVDGAIGVEKLVYCARRPDTEYRLREAGYHARFDRGKLVEKRHSSSGLGKCASVKRHAHETRTHLSTFSGRELLTRGPLVAATSSV